MTGSGTSQRPYLLRAMHEWMTDNGNTPHVIVDAGVAGVEVPAQHVQDGRIVLNVSYAAAHNLHIGNDAITFDARFAGQSYHVCAPVEAVLGIYARESGQGMIFSDREDAADGGSSVTGRDAPPEPKDEADDGPGESSGDNRRAHLRVIK